MKMKRATSVLLAFAVLLSICGGLSASAEGTETSPVYLITKEDYFLSDGHLGSIDYTYDASGNLLKRTVFQDASGKSCLWEEYDYDSSSSLVSKAVFSDISLDDNMFMFLGTATFADQPSKRVYYDKHGQIEIIEHYAYLEDELCISSVEAHDYDSFGRETLSLLLDYANMWEYKLNNVRYYYSHGRGHDPWFDQVEYAYLRGCYVNGVADSSSGQSYYYDSKNRLLRDDDVISPGVVRLYYYDDADNLIRQETNRFDGGYIMNLTLINYVVYSYDQNNNRLTADYYDKNDTLYRYERFNYTEDGRVTDRIIASRENVDSVQWGDWGKQTREVYQYDEHGNMTADQYFSEDGELLQRITYTYSQFPEKPAADSDDREVAEAGIDYDRVLCDGRDGLKLVETYRETLKDVWYEVGVVDRMGHWVVPLSRESKLADELLEIHNDSLWESYFIDICENLHYAGEGIFIYSGRKNDYEKQILDVKTGIWTNPGGCYFYDKDLVVFHNGYIIAEAYNYKGNTIVIIDSDGNMYETDIPSDYRNHSPAGNYGTNTSYGIYSEGVFFAYDGFYDINGKKVIDLSEYTEQIVNHPFFVGGNAILVAVNSAGTEYEAIIDHDGNFLREFTAR